MMSLTEVYDDHDNSAHADHALEWNPLGVWCDDCEVWVEKYLDIGGDTE